MVFNNNQSVKMKIITGSSAMKESELREERGKYQYERAYLHLKRVVLALLFTEPCDLLKEYLP